MSDLPVPMKGDGHGGLWIPESASGPLVAVPLAAYAADQTINIAALTPGLDLSTLLVVVHITVMAAGNMQAFVAFGTGANNALVAAMNIAAVGTWAFAIGKGVSTVALGNYVGGVNVPGGMSTIIGFHGTAYPVTYEAHIYTSGG